MWPTVNVIKQNINKLINLLHKLLLYIIIINRLFSLRHTIKLYSKSYKSIIGLSGIIIIYIAPKNVPILFKEYWNRSLVYARWPTYVGIRIFYAEVTEEENLCRVWIVLVRIERVAWCWSENLCSCTLVWNRRL